MNQAEISFAVRKKMEWAKVLVTHVLESWIQQPRVSPQVMTASSGLL